MQISHFVPTHKRTGKISNYKIKLYNFTCKIVLKMCRPITSMTKKAYKFTILKQIANNCFKSI